MSAAVLMLSDSDLGRYWTIGLVLSVVVVVAVVVLLLVIWSAARRILAAALRCLGAVKAARANTDPLLELTTTNHVAADLLAAAVSIERHARMIGEALVATEVPEGPVKIKGATRR
ncbi:MAG: hypothetical protein NVSMB17_06640 [Candidatus Dormibacteria bacterium]